MASDLAHNSVPADAKPTASTATSALLPQVDVIFNSVQTTSPWVIAASIILGLVLYDQLQYVLNKGSIEGPPLKIPFMGPFLESVNPKFEKYYQKWISGPLSCVSVFHKFVVIASTRDMSRKVFNSPQYVKPCVVDVAHKLLGKDNFVFLHGKAHVDFRKGLQNLFTRKSLESYLPAQEEVYNIYFEKFVNITKQNNGNPVPFMTPFRELMCVVSCRTFVGHYLSEPAVRQIARDYYHITESLQLVNFPIIVPFTSTWYGKKASDVVLKEFASCAAKSKIRMATGGEITCVLDAWVKNMLDSQKWEERESRLENNLPLDREMEDMEKPSPIVRMFSDYEIAQTLFTFLFASQDATSSACTWLFQVVAQRPDVLDRIRKESLEARNGQAHAPLTLEQLESLTYTRAVVRELLRYRPPVLMVPHEVRKPFPITDKYTIPKGAMVVPSTWLALHDPEVYENPNIFDPERYYSGDAEEKGTKNYLVFGLGPHYCLGQVFAQLNLALMISKASVMLDFKHHATPKSEEIKVFATIFPMDDCPLTFAERHL